MAGSSSLRFLRTLAAWAVVAIFFFPIYFWTTVAFKIGNAIFSSAVVWARVMK